MNMTTNTNDKAFPSTFHNGWGEPEKGMTLRDYFAAKAMQGMIAASGNKEGTVQYDDDCVSKNAYLMADKMLKAKKS